MNRSVHKAMLMGIAIGAVALSSARMASAVEWLDSDWTRRIAFTVDPDSIDGSGSFADFTLLVDMSVSGFASVFLNADPDGSDLVITAGDGTTVLDHQLVSFDPVLEDAELWFKALSLSDTANTFYMYYDNDVETPEEAALRLGLPGDAWSAEHLAVYHYAEDPSLGTLADWGPAGADAVATTRSAPVGPGWTTSNLVDGAIGSGWDYDGVDVFTYSTNVSSADSSFTISAWFANQDLIDRGALAFDEATHGWALSFKRTGGQPRANLDTSLGFMTWFPDVFDQDLHHYAWTLDAEADTARFYFDGVEMAVRVRFTHNPAGGPVYSAETIDSRIGIAGPTYWNELDLCDGVVDEYRIIAGVRTPEWLLTEYRNMADPAGFYMIGEEELYSGGSTGTTAWNGNMPFGKITVYPNPFRAVAAIELETAQSDAVVRVYDVKGRLVKTLSQPQRPGNSVLRYLWDGRDAQGSQVSNGIYYIRAQNGRSVVSSKALLVR